MTLSNARNNSDNAINSIQQNPDPIASIAAQTFPSDIRAIISQDEIGAQDEIASFSPDLGEEDTAITPSGELSHLLASGDNYHAGCQEMDTISVNPAPNPEPIDRAASASASVSHHLADTTSSQAIAPPSVSSGAGMMAPTGQQDDYGNSTPEVMTYLKCRQLSHRGERNSPLGIFSNSPSFGHGAQSPQLDISYTLLQNDIIQESQGLQYEGQQTLAGDAPYKSPPLPDQRLVASLTTTPYSKIVIFGINLANLPKDQHLRDRFLDEQLTVAIKRSQASLNKHVEYLSQYRTEGNEAQHTQTASHQSPGLVTRQHIDVQTCEAIERSIIDGITRLLYDKAYYGGRTAKPRQKAAEKLFGRLGKSLNPYAGHSSYRELKEQKKDNIYKAVFGQVEGLLRHYLIAVAEKPLPCPGVIRDIVAYIAYQADLGPLLLPDDQPYPIHASQPSVSAADEVADTSEGEPLNPRIDGILVPASTAGQAPSQDQVAGQRLPIPSVPEAPKQLSPFDTRAVPYEFEFWHRSDVTSDRSPQELWEDERQHLSLYFFVWRDLEKHHQRQRRQAVERANETLGGAPPSRPSSPVRDDEQVTFDAVATQFDDRLFLMLEHRLTHPARSAPNPRIREQFTQSVIRALDLSRPHNGVARIRFPTQDEDYYSPDLKFHDPSYGGVDQRWRGGDHFGDAQSLWDYMEAWGVQEHPYYREMRRVVETTRILLDLHREPFEQSPIEEREVFDEFFGKFRAELINWLHTRVPRPGQIDPLSGNKDDAAHNSATRRAWAESLIARLASPWDCHPPLPSEIEKPRISYTEQEFSQRETMENHNLATTTKDGNDSSRGRPSAEGILAEVKLTAASYHDYRELSRRASGPPSATASSNALPGEGMAEESSDTLDDDLSARVKPNVPSPPGLKRCPPRSRANTVASLAQAAINEDEQPSRVDLDDIYDATPPRRRFVEDTQDSASGDSGSPAPEVSRNEAMGEDSSVTRGDDSSSNGGVDIYPSPTPGLGRFDPQAIMDAVQAANNENAPTRSVDFNDLYVTAHLRRTVEDAEGISRGGPGVSAPVARASRNEAMDKDNLSATVDSSPRAVNLDVPPKLGLIELPTQASTVPVAAPAQVLNNENQPPRNAAYPEGDIYDDPPRSNKKPKDSFSNDTAPTQAPRNRDNSGFGFDGTRPPRTQRQERRPVERDTTSSNTTSRMRLRGGALPDESGDDSEPPAHESWPPKYHFGSGGATSPRHQLPEIRGANREVALGHSSRRRPVQFSIGVSSSGESEPSAHRSRRPTNDVGFDCLRLPRAQRREGIAVKREAASHFIDDREVSRLRGGGIDDSESEPQARPKLPSRIFSGERTRSPTKDKRRRKRRRGMVAFGFDGAGSPPMSRLKRLATNSRQMVDDDQPMPYLDRKGKSMARSGVPSRSSYRAQEPPPVIPSSASNQVTESALPSNGAPAASASYNNDYSTPPPMDRKGKGVDRNTCGARQSSPTLTPASIRGPSLLSNAMREEAITGSRTSLRQRRIPAGISGQDGYPVEPSVDKQGRMIRSKSPIDGQATSPSYWGERGDAFANMSRMRGSRQAELAKRPREFFHREEERHMAAHEITLANHATSASYRGDPFANMSRIRGSRHIGLSRHPIEPCPVQDLRRIVAHQSTIADQATSASFIDDAPIAMSMSKTRLARHSDRQDYGDAVVGSIVLPTRAPQNPIIRSALSTSFAGPRRKDDKWRGSKVHFDHASVLRKGMKSGDGDVEDEEEEDAAEHEDEQNITGSLPIHSPSFRSGSAFDGRGHVIAIAGTGRPSVADTRFQVLPSFSDHQVAQGITAQSNAQAGAMIGTNGSSNRSHNAPSTSRATFEAEERRRMQQNALSMSFIRAPGGRFDPVFNPPSAQQSAAVPSIDVVAQTLVKPGPEGQVKTATTGSPGDDEDNATPMADDDQKLFLEQDLEKYPAVVGSSSEEQSIESDVVAHTLKEPAQSDVDSKSDGEQKTNMAVLAERGQNIPSGSESEKYVAVFSPSSEDQSIDSDVVKRTLQERNQRQDSAIGSPIKEDIEDDEETPLADPSCNVFSESHSEALQIPRKTEERKSNDSGIGMGSTKTNLSKDRLEVQGGSCAIASPALTRSSMPNVVDGVTGDVVLPMAAGASPRRSSWAPAAEKNIYGCSPSTVSSTLVSTGRQPPPTTADIADRLDGTAADSGAANNDESEVNTSAIVFGDSRWGDLVNRHTTTLSGPEPRWHAADDEETSPSDNLTQDAGVLRSPQAQPQSILSMATDTSFPISEGSMAGIKERLLGPGFDLDFDNAVSYATRTMDLIWSEGTGQSAEYYGRLGELAGQFLEVARESRGYNPDYYPAEQVDGRQRRERISSDSSDRRSVSGAHPASGIGVGEGPPDDTASAAKRVRNGYVLDVVHVRRREIIATWEESDDAPNAIPYKIPDEVQSGSGDSRHQNCSLGLDGNHDNHNLCGLRCYDSDTTHNSAQRRQMKWFNAELENLVEEDKRYNEQRRHGARSRHGRTSSFTERDIYRSPMLIGAEDDQSFTPSPCSRRIPRERRSSNTPVKKEPKCQPAPVNANAPVVQRDFLSAPAVSCNQLRYNNAKHRSWPPLPNAVYDAHDSLDVYSGVRNSPSRSQSTTKLNRTSSRPRMSRLSRGNSEAFNTFADASNPGLSMAAGSGDGQASPEGKGKGKSVSFARDEHVFSMEDEEEQRCFEFCGKCKKRHIVPGPLETLNTRDTCLSMLPEWFPKIRFPGEEWKTFESKTSRHLEVCQTLAGQYIEDTRIVMESNFDSEYHEPTKEWAKLGRHGGWWLCRINSEDPLVPRLERECRVCTKRAADTEEARANGKAVGWRLMEARAHGKAIGKTETEATFEFEVSSKLQLLREKWEHQKFVRLCMERTMREDKKVVLERIRNTGS